MGRTVRVGPSEQDIADTLQIGIHFPIPAGSILRRAVITPSAFSTPPTAVRIALYPTKEEASTKYSHQLVPIAYMWATLTYRVGVVWEGTEYIPDDYEYTLELTTHNLTGATLRSVAMAIYEEKDRK